MHEFCMHQLPNMIMAILYNSYVVDPYFIG
jgi:hypothetical protein